jgi:ribosomal protein S18 acetylase RimI-like enzyme
MTISQTNPGQIRPAGEPEGRIVRIGPARRAEAVARLVGPPGDPAAAERFLTYARTTGIRLDGLWARLDARGAVTHSVLCVPSDGRTAMVFATRPGDRSQVAGIATLIDHACGQLESWPLDLAQALLDPAADLERATFVDAGFSDLAMLSYLERPLSRSNLPPKAVWPDGAEPEPYREELVGDLERALEASYVETLDCPGLYGLRRTADIIAGHRATGVFDAGLWTLLRLHGHPVGAVLLNLFPSHKTVELVYLGLAPEARGRGLGRQLLRHALWLLAPRRERTLTLAVDERNVPALSLYRSENMRRTLQRVALIRPFRETGASRG